MKKILASLLVLALVAPAFAIDFTATDMGNGQLRVNYTLTAGEVLRGMALKVAVTSGNAVVAATDDVVIPAASFNTFIDYAFSNPTGYAVGAGHPLANPAAAGVLDLSTPKAEFVVSLGYLDTAGAQGGITASSFFDIFFDLSGTSAGTITADTLRGGIVGDAIVAPTTLPLAFSVTKVTTCTVSQPTLVKAVNPGYVNTDVTSIAATATSSLGHTLDYSFDWGSGAGAYGAATQTNTYAFTAAGTETVTVVAHCTVDGAVSVASAPMTLTREAIMSTASYITVWRNWNRPSCWAFKKQCNGDSDGALELTKPVMGKDLTLFKLAYNKADSVLATVVSNGVPGICSDYEKTAELTKRVMGKDLTILKNYYNKANSLVPTCASTNLNFYTN